uniref:Uncharacterized protein n=1 Tax=Arundo donax TaxID=35708 RepID=A0A0A9C3M7_ARUDO
MAADEAALPPAISANPLPFIPRREHPSVALPSASCTPARRSRA